MPVSDRQTKLYFPTLLVSKTLNAEARSPTRRPNYIVICFHEFEFACRVGLSFIGTIEGWDHLLKEEKYKHIILNSLEFLTHNNRVRINAIVIMSNHIHLIWQATGGHSLKEVQTAFKKYTSQLFMKMLKEENNLEKYEVNKADRKHHFWKRNSLGTELYTPAVPVQ